MNYNYIHAHQNSSINSVAHIECTNFVLTGGGNDCSVKLHNLSECLSTTLPREHTRAINSISLSQSKEFFCSASQDNIVIWDLVKHMKINRVQATNDQTRDQILDCKILNNNIIVSCGTNYRLNFFDLRQANKVRPLHSITIGNDNLNTMDFLSNYVLSIGSSNGNLYSVDLRNQEIITDKFENGSIVSIDALDDSCLLQFENGLAKFFDLKKEETRFEINTFQDPINYKTNSLIIKDYYKEEIKYIISGSEEGCINLWQGERESFRKYNSLEIKSHELSKESLIINNVRFDSTKNRIVGASGSGMLHIWDNVL